MSRIQQILEKAERDGGIARLRPVASTDAAAPFEFHGTDMPLDTTDGVLMDEVATRLAPGRVVRNVRLAPALASALIPGAAAAEQYRALRTRIAQAERLTPLNLIVVTSPGRGEGKSLTTANLGLTMAQDVQRRICLVDADLRNSSLHTLFGLSGAPGLSDVLTGRAGLEDALVGLDDQHITVLPAGNVVAHPAELLGSATMQQTIASLRAHFDRVLIDAPATGPLADLGILAPLVDRVVLVVRAGITTKPAIQEAVATIGADRLLGVVLNDAAN
ncbi:MAG TPA: CpsD/CapB family tyrosine-protein kinase [Vicinamibacterales bacterium]|jgi:capsular exopolysaccharide synthesis family protein